MRSLHGLHAKLQAVLADGFAEEVEGALGGIGLLQKQNEFFQPLTPILVGATEWAKVELLNTCHQPHLQSAVKHLVNDGDLLEESHRLMQWHDGAHWPWAQPSGLQAGGH